MSSRPDTKVLHEEARKKLKTAMLTYPGDPAHVAVYVLSIELSWNELQLQLGRSSSHASRPARVSQICDAVDEHLESQLKSYLNLK